MEAGRNDLRPSLGTNGSGMEAMTRRPYLERTHQQPPALRRRDELAPDGLLHAARLSAVQALDVSVELDQQAAERGVAALEMGDAQVLVATV